MTLEKYNLSELSNIAKLVIEKSKYKIILFNGKMGAGKTTLIKEICRHLRVEELSHSPSFSLVNEYQSINNTIIYHFDLYRINNEDEALDIGIEEYLYSGNWCFIEWSEKIKNLLPLEVTTATITLDADGNDRIITITQN